MSARGVAAVFSIGALIAASAPRAAHAEPPADAALIWQAPDSCPDAAEVRARIARRLGAPVDRVVRGVAVAVAVARDGRGPRYVARIDLRGLRATTAAGESPRARAAEANPVTSADGRGAAAVGNDEIRVLTSARCDELADAVAVVIARIAAEAAPEAALDAAPEAAIDGAALHAERPVVVREAEPARRSPWGGGLRVIGLSGIGALPGVSVGGELSAYVRARWLIAELGGMTWLRSVSFRRAAARVDVSLALAAVRVGWGPPHVPLRAWLAAELGTVHGDGLAPDNARGGTGRWVAVGTGFAVAWPMFEHARLVGSIELAVPLVRDHLVLQDGSEAYLPGPVTVRSGLGLEVGWR